MKHIDTPKSQSKIIKKRNSQVKNWNIFILKIMLKPNYVA